MVRKKLAFAVAAAAVGALQANPASALGLGEFTLHSALNQPLNGEIKVLDTRGLDPSELKITLANQQDFKRAGVSRDYFLTNLKFKVELNGHGGGVIKVTSHDPVVEPYLDFLVQARWPTGRLLREYTVLLDLPVFSKSHAAPVSTATTTAASPSAPAASQTAPAAAQMPASAPAAVAGGTSRLTLTEGALKAGEKYRVRRNDTLWDIAAKSRPSHKVSVQQTMVTIQRLNRNAFMRGNINRLKAGYVLRLPTEAEVAKVSSGRAIQEVAAQNRAWRTGNYAAENTARAQLDASSTGSTGKGKYKEQARLSIATAGNSETGPGGEGKGAGSEALRNQLDASKENLDKAKRENQELHGRLNDMDSKIATLQKLLDLKDDQLAELQNKLKQQQAAETQPSSQQATQQPATGKPGAGEQAGAKTAPPAEGRGTSATGEASTAAGQPATPNTSPETSPAETAAPKTAAGGEAGAPTQEAPKATKPSEPAPPAPAPKTVSSLQKILGNPVYLGGAGLVVVLLAFVLYLRKRSGSEEEEQGFGLFDEEKDEGLDTVALDSEELDLGEGEEENLDNADVLAAELEQEIAADQAAEVQADQEKPAEAVQSETGDAVAEAEIYIAYGRYQQAIDLLTTAIAQEPERSDIRVKLLEVYVETRDKPAFQQQYLALQQLGDDQAVGQVKEMLSTVDGVADWLDDLSGAGGEISDADMDAELIGGGEEETDLALDDELDIDIDLDQLGDTQEGPALSLDSDELNLDLDEAASSLDTTQSLEAISPDQVEAATGSLNLDEEELTLDLDSGEADQAETAAEGFDLDLEGDGDLELDLGDLGDTDLSDLEAEFGEAGDKHSASESESGEFDVDLDTSGDLDMSDDVDIDLSDTGQTESDTISFDTEAMPAELDTDFELSETGEESEETVSFEEEVAEPAPQPAVDTAPPDSGNLAEVMSADAAEGDEFDFLADTDEVATKLDLARAYIDMGDTEGAKDILDEVLQEGSDEQKQEAQTLMERV